MNSSLQSTPTKPNATTFETTRFIHKFGYHLAKKLLGPSIVNKCLKEADQSIQKMDGKQSNQTYSYRANWRGPVSKFPWLFAQSQPNDSSGITDGHMTPETIFIDITFDFLVFPFEITEDGRTSFCHVVRSHEWEEDSRAAEDGRICLSVAIRIGALIAIPDNKERDIGNSEVLYRYFYQRGNPLKGPAVYQHCRCVDIVPEEMDAAQISDIIANALANNEVRVMIKLKDENESAFSTSGINSPLAENTNDASTKKWQWALELHHHELGGKGSLPMKKYEHTNLFSHAYDEKNWGTFVDQNIMDSYLLNNGQLCVSIPALEAKSVWDDLDPTLLNLLKKPVKPFSPRKPAVLIPDEEKPSPLKTEDRDKSQGKAKPKIRKASPMKKENVLFAKGKRTTVAGQRKKKPKFTIGPK